MAVAGETTVVGRPVEIRTLDGVPIDSAFATQQAQCAVWSPQLNVESTLVKHAASDDRTVSELELLGWVSARFHRSRRENVEVVDQAPQLRVRKVEGGHSLVWHAGLDQGCDLGPRVRAKVVQDAGCAVCALAVARVAEHATTREGSLAVRDGLLAESSCSDCKEQGGEPQ